MPQLTEHIGPFDKGMMIGVDPSDIPIGGSYVQIDTDPLVLGQLAGRYTDTQITKRILNAVSYGWLSDERYHHLIYVGKTYDGSYTAWGIYAYKSFYTNTDTYAELLGNVPVPYQGIPNVSTVVEHSRAHIGLGKTQKPKWVGLVGERFGQSQKGARKIEIADAECIITNLMPALTDFWVDGTGDNIYGIIRGGKFLYKINKSGSTFTLTKTTERVFTNTQAFCIDKDTGYAWVLDRTSVYGTLRRVNLSTMEIDSYHVISGVDDNSWLSENMIITDIAVTTNATSGTLYMSARSLNKVQATGPLLVRLKFTETSAGSRLYKWVIANGNDDSITITNVTPNFYPTGTDPTGGWSVKSTTLTGASPTYIDIDEASGEPDPTFWNSPPKALVVFDSTNIGWAFNIDGPENAIYVQTFPYKQYGPVFKDSAGNHVLAKNNMAVVNDSDTKSTLLQIYTFGGSGNESEESVPTGWAYHDDGAYEYIYRGLGDYVQYFDQNATYPTASGQKIDLALPGNRVGIPTTGFGDGQYEISPGGKYLSNLYVSRTGGRTSSFKTMKIYNNTPLGEVTDWYTGTDIVITVTDLPSTAGLTKSTTYWFKVALEYDKTQLSPISDFYAAVDHDDTDDDQLRVDITLKNVDTLSPRVTGVYLFAGTSKYDGASRTGHPDGLYRLVTYAGFDDPRWTVTTTGTSTVAEFFHIVEDDAFGQTYEQVAAVPESLTKPIVSYGLSAALNGYLFVAGCAHEEIDDASHMIFRSKALRYDTFDWTTDYLTLKNIPTALAAFNGRLFVFTSGAIYRINPENFYIEDEFVGYGVQAQYAVCTTEYGIFFANRSGAYFYDGVNITDISIPIKTVARELPGSASSTAYYGDADNIIYMHGIKAFSWAGAAGITQADSHLSWVTSPFVGYLPRTKQVYFLWPWSYLFLGAYWSQYLAFVYSLDSKSWSFQTIANSDQTYTAAPYYLYNGFFTDPLYNNLYFSAGSLSLLLQDTSKKRKGYVWISGLHHAGSLGGRKRFYSCKLMETNGPAYTDDSGTRYGFWFNAQTKSGFTTLTPTTGNVNLTSSGTFAKVTMFSYYCHIESGLETVSQSSFPTYGITVYYRPLVALKTGL